MRLEFFSKVSNISTVSKAQELLRTLANITPAIERAIEFATKAHEGQKRKSGEPYIVHPLLVSCIVAHYGGDEAMICAALLHDVVEDTNFNLQDVSRLFGEDVASLVDSLTKIVEIREEEFPSELNQKLIIAALSFRKMLLASIKDIRALVIKLCDRTHNMLTLDALPRAKQIRISEETLVVYAPIAHRLGISSMKNELEDQSFRYIFPDEYGKIDDYFDKNRQAIQLKLHAFIDKVKHLLMLKGLPSTEFHIISRIKRHYSIYLKMQRKGISIEEVLDLLAIRVIVKEPLDCYKVLGILHYEFKPIVSRFKDYIALPKENGYQTIHTTLFDDSSIFEVQIRTEAMQHSAEYGVAAHWKYKNGGIAPSLGWLSDLQFQNNTIEEFYELVKNDLYREDITVFSPAGDTYMLPSGAVALDFAYAVHTEVGNCAKEAYINNQKASLLSVLKSGDIVRILTAKEPIVRASWIDAVKTSRAKHEIRASYAAKLREIEKRASINILATIFGKSAEEIMAFVKGAQLEGIIHKACKDVSYLKELKNRICNNNKHTGILNKIKIKILKLKEFSFDNILIHSNYNISEALFDYCCHPKYGDEVIALKSGSKAFVHHKLCERAYGEIEKGAKMVYVEWVKDKLAAYQVIVALENQKGVLANFLQFLAKNDFNVLGVDLGSQKNSYTSHCEVQVESHIKDAKLVRSILAQRFRIVDLYSLKDAYGNN